ncbi:DNA polymerase Y family protein [Paramicrobacterium fandaimingii]|uniref:DNA polymerase Y family protein n=1 Tax=Paramicrobacterium fandaimingii TaxID=2708079 RepID=UPI00141EB9B1|nr:DNA polymerase Y family protein [Microbacterium fandaimingii]
MGTSTTRTLVLRFPGWSAAAAATAHGAAHDLPLAVLVSGVVSACNAAASAWGVAPGQRLREAQAACPQLEVHPYDRDADYRAFEGIFQVIEERAPGGQILQPGLCALRLRGPSRYYGGERAAAETLTRAVRASGFADVRAGIADGIFPAELAARRARAGEIVAIPSADTARFVAAVPIDELPAEALAENGPLLHRLGVHLLGDYARLDVAQVRDRFGPDAVRVHRLANGDDPRMVVPTETTLEYSVHREFDEALDRIDQIAFSLRADIDALTQRVAESQKVATSIRIELRDDRGGLRERTWLHPRFFRAPDIVDRVRWQVQGTQAGAAALEAPISAVLITVVTIDDRAHYEAGLWGESADQRVHNSITRVQSMIGHTGVCTLQPGEGRLLRERQLLVPWGEKRSSADRSSEPWPGSQTGLAPSLVFENPAEVAVLDTAGEVASLTERGTLRAPLMALSLDGSIRMLRGWAGPWSVDARWWDARRHQRVHRFQAVDDHGDAWMLTMQSGRWSVEARYD